MKAKRRRVKMEIEMDIPGKNETKYTKLVGEMLEAFENADPANKKEEFAELLQALGFGSGFIIGSILDKGERKDLLEIFLKGVIESTNECSRMHLIANSDVGIKAD
jgi:hypothetical protein